MKLMVSLVIIIIGTFCYASAGIAQTHGLIGLFANANHDTWCATGTGFYPVEMWIWCYPSSSGQMCAEYGIGYPANVITSTITINIGIVSGVLGDLAEGVSIWYSECQYDWNWNIHQTLYVTDPTKTACEIIPHCDTGFYRFASCLEGYPIEPCIHFTNLYLNYKSTDPECSG